MTGMTESEAEKNLKKETHVTFDRNDHKGAAPMLGGASIIMVFAVLCLTIFAVLTLSTVENEYRISAEYASSVENYYKADAEAVAFTAAVRKAAGSNADAASYRNAAQQNGADSAVEDADGVIIRKQFRIDDSQSLLVVLEASGTALTVRNWQTVFTGNWDSSSEMQLWEGVPEE